MQDIASDDGLTYFPGQFKEQEEPWEIRDWLANAKEACPDSPEVSEATGSNPQEPEAQRK